jgi:hypothetical protein
VEGTGWDQWWQKRLKHKFGHGVAIWHRGNGLLHRSLLLCSGDIPSGRRFCVLLLS